MLSKKYPASNYQKLNFRCISGGVINIIRDIEELKETAQEVLDIDSIRDQNKDLLDGIVEELSQKLDLSVGIPVFSVFSTIHKVGKSFFDYIMIVRLLKFYTECRNIDEAKREKFCKKNVYGKESRIGYHILQLLERRHWISLWIRHMDIRKRILSI